ncbi:esterase/lipase family protein [Actinomycetospora termitidis]|uniref:Lipase n=1 Tax=Actinomycetospora termitidis TaxID=3053470 RepID=A0ABT7MAP2_9PSEU|nr:lipase [Actinomycetospora sp. Odt1-22]MDL5156493.1 lipase [Actinomycetospora sp. Odt1-22]
MNLARRIGLFLVVLLLGIGAASGSAAANDGPALSVPADALRQSLACHGDLAARQPVLLIPGTTLTPAEFDWNYARAFTATGRPFCSVTLPQNALGDLQVAAEYVVSAIRTMSERAGGKIDLLGHSQGGMIGRWALKFFPDTRGKVDDYVALAPSTRGTVDAPLVCAVPAVGCAPAIWQQAPRSRFLAALNAGGETVPGVDYTVAYTIYDEIVVPNLAVPRGVPVDATPPANSPIRGGGDRVSNISLQGLCGVTRVVDHFGIGTSDAVAYAIAVDALDHDGPAQADRIGRGVCLRPFQPGVNPVTFPLDFAGLVASAGTALATGPFVPREPALAPYAQGAG